MFKRRDRRPVARLLLEFLYPKGGWTRAATYIHHRMRRLPDAPHRIARGIFAGVFVNFPPIFGFQFLAAALFAWSIRGNILAALLCTFLSNPITTPFIAIGSVELGHWMLGIDVPLDARMVLRAFLDAGHEIWQNLRAIFTSEPTRWHSLSSFFKMIYWPYMVGSIIPGLIVSTICYYISLPIIGVYQRIREKKKRERLEKRIAARQAAAQRAEQQRAADLLAADQQAASLQTPGTPASQPDDRPAPPAKKEPRP